MDQDAQNPAPAAQTLELSRGDRELLRHLSFRELGEHGSPSWLLAEPRGRLRLVVKTMMGTWGRAPFARNRSTVRRLEDEGLVMIGEPVRLPAPFDSRQGRKISLTPLGLATTRRAGEGSSA